VNEGLLPHFLTFGLDCGAGVEVSEHAGVLLSERVPHEVLLEQIPLVEVCGVQLHLEVHVSRTYDVGHFLEKLNFSLV